MSVVERRIVQVTYQDFVVSAGQLGAAVEDVREAIYTAREWYVDKFGEGNLSDHWARVVVEDDCIVVRVSESKELPF